MAVVICPDCGKEQDSNSKFCKNCGADLSKVVVEENTDLNASEDLANGDVEENADLNISEDSSQVSASQVSASQVSASQVSTSQDDESVDVSELGGNGADSFDSQDDESEDVPVLDEKDSDSSLPVSDSQEDLKNEEKVENPPIAINKNNNLNFCPSCGEKIESHMGFCPKCGLDLNKFKGNALERSTGDVIQKSNSSLENRNPLIAAILSFLFPGLGQFYNGQNRKGISFVIVAIISVFLFIILIGGLIYILIWLWSLLDAYQSAEAINRGEVLKDSLL